MADDIEIFTSFSQQQSADTTKVVPREKMEEYIQYIEREMDFEILPIIKKIILKETKSFSLCRENPMRYIFVSNGSDNISISTRAFGKQSKILIPKAFFED